MHYYTFNIGDYKRDTDHLTLLEHGIYRSLLDSYYLNDGYLTPDYAKLMRTHCIRSAEEQEAFKNVLADFFDLKEDRYSHEGCDKVLDQIYNKSEKARLSAKIRWDKNKMRTQCERNANGMLPITHNPIPIRKEKKGRFAPPSIEEVKKYCSERNNNVNPESFINHYEANGWMRGKNKIKSWKACVRTWEAREEKNQDLSITKSPNGWVTEMRDDPFNKHIFEGKQ